MNEFEVIKKFFQKPMKPFNSVILGIGDDCALLKPIPGQVLAVSTDTLVEGAHFFSDTHPEDLGYKSLAVNLSDLAAMGATPAWATLALTLPEENENWLIAFCRGFFELANRYNVSLVGGDLTRGPLTITIQIMGFTSEETALRRDKAKVGDAIYVSGTLGDAAAALAFLKEKKFSEDQESLQILLNRLHRPDPRVELGLALQGKAHAAIDISDGLIGDLTHILEQSHVGATLFLDKLPLSGALRRMVSIDQAYEFALSGGDDYELCFTWPEHETFLSPLINLPCTCIGKIESCLGLRIVSKQGENYISRRRGYQHFE